MLFVIILGAITSLGILGVIIGTNFNNKLFYKKYQVLDKMCDKYFYRNPSELTNDELEEYDKLKRERNKYWTLSDIFEKIVVPCATIAIISGIILFIILLILMFTNIPYEVKIANNKEVQNYQKLILELENPEVRDDFNIRTKDLIDDVTEWNKDYDTYVYRHNNLWTNWFYPSGTIQGVDRINLEDYF